jgi:hypothetical protein
MTIAARPDVLDSSDTILEAASDGTARSRSPEAWAARALPIFAFLWAFSALFHQAAYPDRAFGLSALLVTLPAIWVLLRPDSVPRFVAAVALQCVQIWRLGPANVSNHWIFTFFVDLTILIALASLVVRKRSGRVTGGALLLTFAPAARLELLGLYFYAVLHKLNDDFLNPALSCATNHYNKIAGYATFLPQGAWVYDAVIYGTLVVEASIPILLVVRRTRLFGILLATMFHFGLALNPEHTFFDFSSMLMAMYFLFVPFDYWNSLRSVGFRSQTGQWLWSRVRREQITRWGRRIAIALGVALVATYAQRLAPRGPVLIDTLQETTRLIFVFYAAAVVTVFLLVARMRDVVGETRGLVTFRPRGATLIIPVLVLFNGMTPYLGLKTEASFSMFSNLRTESRPNHILIPGHAHLSSYQDDLVKVLDSSSPTLQRLSRVGTLVPFHELRRRVATGTLQNASIAYERGGRVFAYARAADDPELARPLSLVERKLFRFRVIDPPGVGTPCRH